MCIGMGSGSVTTVEPEPTVPEAAQLPETPTSAADARTQKSADRRRRAAATGSGSRSTILTGPRGVTQQGAVTTKTLLGE